MNTQKSRLCAICHSELIFVSTVTEKIEGSLFPQTTTIYKCSNTVCQEDQDTETQKRQKMKESKELTEKAKAEERARKRQEYVKGKLTP